MPRMNDMYPSKWLAAADLDEAGVTLTVSGVEQETIGDDSKWVCYFHEEEKGLVLNKTNARSISGIYGDDTDDWLGKQVVLFPTQVDFQGKTVDAIRVKERATKQLAQARQRKAAQAAPAPVVQTRPRPMTQAEVDGEIDDQDSDIPF